MTTYTTQLHHIHIIANSQNDTETLFLTGQKVYTTSSCNIADFSKSELRPRHAALRESPELLSVIATSSSCTNMDRQQVFKRRVRSSGITSAQQVRHCLLSIFRLFQLSDDALVFNMSSTQG